MPSPLSVVIPTLNAADELGPTAAALMPGLAAGMIRDLVVSDGGSTDGTEALADALGATWVSGPAGRGGQIALGVAAAKGDWLLLLHADTRLSPDWAGETERFVARDEGRAGYFRLRFRAKGLWPRTFEAGVRLRSRVGLPYGDQGLVLSRATLSAVGGVPDQPLMEDVALARALSGRLTALDAVAETSAARYLAEGWARRGARNLGLLARYMVGTPPERLVGRYEGRG